MLAYPIVLWEARENLKRIVFGSDAQNKAHSSSASYSPLVVSEEFTVLDEHSSTMSFDERVQGSRELPLRDSFRVHAAISIVLVYLTATLGALVTDLEVVFGLVGSTCTPIIAYVLPAYVYIKSGAAAKNEDQWQPKVALSIGMLLVPFGLTVWILDRAGKLVG